MTTSTAPLRPGVTLQAAIDSSDELSDWLDSTLCVADVTLDKKGVVSTAYACIALEHRAAIRLLIGAGAHATAMTATRAALEAFVLAMWVVRIAANDMLDEFLAGRRDPPGADKVLRDLAKKGRPDDQMWVVLQRQYKVLNDYAHGGPRQVTRWMRQGEIAPRYTDGQMAETMRFVDLVGVFAAFVRESNLGQPDTVLNALLRKRDDLLAAPANASLECGTSRDRP